MFVTVKALTIHMDNNIRYVKEAYENRENHEKEVFDNYIERMKVSLNNQLKELRRISCNKKLIDSYSDKIENVFAEGIA